MKKDYIYTITEITKEIKRLLENNFTNIWVRGEISNLHVHSSGHIYLSLKDQNSQIRAVIFKSRASQLKFRLRNGLSIVVFGYLTVYEVRGDYQLIIEYAEPTGLGALYEAFEELKRKLEKKGLFDLAHKKPLPMIPQKVAIVTSPTGAAIRDILSVINRRFANIEILIYPVKVQGEEASKEIVEAIRFLNRKKEVEVIILARGGGSIEDLWAFNEEEVAYAIYNSKIPIISAVGHEVDFTIADFVADVRAATPSIAGEILTKNKEELRLRLSSLRSFIISRIHNIISRKKSELKSFQNSILFKRPYYKLDRLGQDLDNYINIIQHNFTRNLELSKNRFFRCLEYNIFKSPYKYLVEPYGDELNQKRQLLVNILKEKLKSMEYRSRLAMEKLDSFSPLKTLARGYSITYLYPEGIIVKESSQVEEEKEIKVRLYKGEILAKVTNIYE
jgi:exodeoxyribonuclease VII large subunit